MRISTPPRRRTLRSYRRVAWKDHGLCHCCNHPIEAGDEYEGFVSVVDVEGKKHFNVSKYHVYCPFDPDDEPKLEQVEDKVTKRAAA